MNKEKLTLMKKILLALSLVGTMFLVSGCNDNDEKNEIPTLKPINYEYNNIDKYYKLVEKDGKTIKLYDSKYV